MPGKAPAHRPALCPSGSVRSGGRRGEARGWTHASPLLPPHRPRPSARRWVGEGLTPNTPRRPPVPHHQHSTPRHRGPTGIAPHTPAHRRGFRTGLGLALSCGQLEQTGPGGAPQALGVRRYHRQSRAAPADAPRRGLGVDRDGPRAPTSSSEAGRARGGSWGAHARAGHLTPPATRRPPDRRSPARTRAGLRVHAVRRLVVWGGGGADVAATHIPARNAAMFRIRHGWSADGGALGTSVAHIQEATADSQSTAEAERAVG